MHRYTTGLQGATRSNRRVACGTPLKSRPRLHDAAWSDTKGFMRDVRKRKHRGAPPYGPREHTPLLNSAPRFLTGTVQSSFPEVSPSDPSLATSSTNPGVQQPLPDPGSGGTPAAASAPPAPAPRRRTREQPERSLRLCGRHKGARDGGARRLLPSVHRESCDAPECSKGAGPPCAGRDAHPIRLRLGLRPSK